MSPEDRRHAAQAILEFPLLMELFAELERQAIDACLYAKLTDDEARLAHAIEARTIRNLISRLRSLANEGQTEPRKAPA